jgi:serine/threonine protein kinase
MVMEHCDGGELFKYITENGKMDASSERTKNIFRQIVEAVSHCHEKNFAHRYMFADSGI